MYFWGPHFPPEAAYWDGHFPDGSTDPTYFYGFGPDGMSTFALDLESGFTVTYTWVTDIIKRYSGTEQRIAINDAPKQNYDGSAYLMEDNPRRIYAALARYVAIGSTFLLGLPHEEMTLIADASGTSVYVSSTEILLCDWAKIGQRVIVVDLDGEYSKAVVQGTGAGGEILLDVSMGSIGRAGGRIMPTMPIYLHPQQGFVRYPVNVEEWKINARAAIFDFAPTLASIDLGSVTTSPVFNGVVATSRQFGLIGNTLVLEFDGNAGFAATGQLIETGPLTLFRYRPDVTTLQDLADALVASANFKLTGTWNPTDVFSALDEHFTYATGGVASGDIGTGATINEYADRPIWDRPIQVDKAAGDSIQALTEILDMDGIPYAIGSADYADWGRQIILRRTTRAERQWFKKFVSTVRGRQVAWWLPTYRHDLDYVSHTATEINVNSDVMAWWPDQRSHIRVVQADGTITNMQITDVVVETNSTRTLTVSETLSVSAITAISWLELCRFENDEFAVEFNGAQFAVNTQARVVRE